MSEWPPASPSADLTDDPSIPLLTDRIYLPAVELDTALPSSPPPHAAAEPDASVTEEPMPEADEAGFSVDGLSAEGVEVVELQAPSVDAEAPEVDEEGALEAELDRALIATSEADFDELLSAERHLGAGDAQDDAAAPVAIEGSTVLPVDHGAPEAGMPDASPAPAPPVDEATIEAQAEALRSAVLQRVVSRLPEQVNAAVRDLMQPAIDQAMAKLGEEAELAMRITLQELVEQALREELTRQQGGERH